MVFVNPRPVPERIKVFYPREFYDVQTTPEQLLREKEATLSARARMLSGRPPGRLLDVGCQKGEFLLWMSRLGWDVQGVEFSQTPPNLFGMPISYGSFESAQFAPHSFDVITMWAVLEHVHDPVDTLARAARLLRPGGRAFVLVPNFRSLPARIMRHDDVPRHLLMFTPATLAKAAALGGLRVRKTVFSDDIFSGSTRGVLNFLIKRAFGETYDEILAQNRSPARWTEFEGCLNGRQSKLMQWVNKLDYRLTPWIDALMRNLHCSFIMTAELEAVTPGR
jgi:2-polyprenyl-3-methyl-5-hydroxy-6-metoxy-1,4-benzoquinol methylase